MKVSFKIILLFIVLAFASMGQGSVLTIAEKMPEFNGGTNELAKFLGQNVQYPAMARESGITGKVYVNFIVDTSGKILSPKIVKSGGSKDLNDEALRVVSLMPNWIAGVDSGKKVSVYINLPVIFGASVNGRPQGLSMGPKEPEAKPMTAAQKEAHEKAMTYYYQGHKLEQQQKFDKALEKFDMSLKSESENKFALFDKAKMHLNLGDKKQACNIWNKMIALNLRKEEAEEAIKKNCN